jgi:hypothetical protein
MRPQDWGCSRPLGAELLVPCCGGTCNVGIGLAPTLTLHRPARAQPSGDTPTRSALLDCLASGLAVPAVFDPALAAMLPFADVLNYTALLAHVPLDESSEGSAALDILAGVGLEERAAKLAAVERVAHVRRRACLPSSLCLHAGQGHALSGLSRSPGVAVHLLGKHPAQQLPSHVAGVQQRSFLAVRNLMVTSSLAPRGVCWL